MRQWRRDLLKGCCYHIVQRCHERRFLFRFSRDRNNYLSRLWQLRQKYRVVLLDYILTSNHVHLLIWAKNPAEISESMRFLQGASAQDYNRRKCREGAFWRGRYQATIVQRGIHTARCLFYLDFNMIRAGVVKHPEDWRWSGYQELSGRRRRYRTIEIPKLQNFIGLKFDNEESFRNWYREEINKLSSNSHKRVGCWSDSVAVGDLEWISKLSQIVPHGRKKIFQIPKSNAFGVNEKTTSFALITSEKNRAYFTRNLLETRYD